MLRPFLFAGREAERAGPSEKRPALSTVIPTDSGIHKPDGVGENIAR